MSGSLWFVTGDPASREAAVAHQLPASRQRRGPPDPSLCGELIRQCVYYQRNCIWSVVPLHILHYVVSPPGLLLYVLLLAMRNTASGYSFLLVR